MYLVVLNLCLDPHSRLPHPSPSLPPKNRSACPPSRLILIRIPRNRPAVRFCADASLACALCDAKVVRQGHPQNFVRPSIEEEHKFGGWICPRRGWRVRQLLAVGKGDLDRNSAKSPGNAVLQEGSTSTRQLRCRSREAGSSSKLCQTFYRRRTEVWGMDLSEVDATKRGLEGSARVRFAGIRQLQRGQCLRGREVVREARG